MAEALLKYETIGVEQIEDIMADRAIREPASWRTNKDAQDKLDANPAEGKARGEQQQQSLKLDESNAGTVSADGSSSISNLPFRSNSGDNLISLVLNPI